MKNRRKPLANLRRPASRRLKTQNILEVKIRSQLANQQRNRWLMVWTCKLLLASALIGGSIYGVREGLRRCFWQNPEYNLAAVEITNDGSGISREVVLGTAGLKIGTYPLFQFLELLAQFILKLFNSLY